MITNLYFNFLLIYDQRKSGPEGKPTPISKIAVCALQINCKILTFLVGNPAEMSRRSILCRN